MALYVQVEHAARNGTDRVIRVYELPQDDPTGDELAAFIKGLGEGGDSKPIFQVKNVSKNLTLRFDKTSQYLLTFKTNAFRVYDFRGMIEESHSAEHDVLDLTKKAKNNRDEATVYHEVLLAEEDSLSDYARIMDARLVSNGDGTFDVRFACQVTGQNKIDFIYYYGLGKGGKLQNKKRKEEIPFLTYFDKKLKKLRVDISEDL